MTYLVQRLAEPSTWRGLALIATALGVNLAPDMQEAVVSAGIAVAGLIGVMTRDTR